MIEPVFLSKNQVLYIQEQEARTTSSPTILRDEGGLEAAIEAPKATFEGEYLMDLFEMAATYIVSLATNHPFLDANKRTAAASALVFLRANGFIVKEQSEEELADQILHLLTHHSTKDDLIVYLRSRSEKVP